MKQTNRICCTLSNIKNSTLYEPAIQNKLASLAKKGDRNAKELLIKSMYGFVYAVARQKAPRPDMVEDLAQEIFLTLSGRCLNAYDETKRINFRSYAAYWVAAVVDRYLNTHLVGFPYHIPSNVGAAFRNGNKQNIAMVDELRERKVITTIQDKDGEDLDVFDVIPCVDEGYERIFNDDYRTGLEKQIEVVLSGGKHKDTFFRFFNLGKYKDFPVNSVRDQAREMGISIQRLSIILHKSYDKLRNIEK